MLSRGVGSLDLAFGFDKRGIEVGLSSRFKAVYLSIDYATELPDGFQWYDHERCNIEGHYSKQIIILELARHGLSGFLSVQDTVFFAHATGLVDNQNHGSGLFLARWVLLLHREEWLRGGTAIVFQGGAVIASEHQKTVALSCVPLDGNEIVGGKSAPLNIVEDNHSITGRRWWAISST